MNKKFREVAHAGGQIVMHFRTDDQGSRTLSFEYSGDRPVPMACLQLWIRLDGTPLDICPMTGIGGKELPRPERNATTVLLISDSEGMFGHKCPRCSAYWRSTAFANFCVSCGGEGASITFLSDAQRRFLRHFGDKMMEACDVEGDHSFLIDLNIVADAAEHDAPLPPFYGSEERQQKRFKCTNCGDKNDILGRFAYCTRCGMRNDLEVFKNEVIAGIRARLNADTPAENALRDAVAAFDSYVGTLAEQLADRVAMVPARRERLRKSFHDFSEVCEIFSSWFGISLGKSLKAGELEDCRRMFLRRHVHEHGGGIVDEVYLRESGDRSVRLGEHLEESKGEVHDLLGRLVRVATDAHAGFHEIFRFHEKNATAWNARYQYKTDPREAKV